MSRGSISSWQDYGRRNSHIIPQFRGSPVEYMTSDDIQLKRKDGWFLSYPKIAAVIIVFVIGVIAAGFLGWYINSLPKKKPYDSMDLLTDEIEDTDIIDQTSTSPFVHPFKYRLELMPIINDADTSSLKGRVIIEFEIIDAPSVNTLSLSAKNITVTSYKLSLLDREDVKTRLKRRRLRSDRNETINASHVEDERLVTSVYSRTENMTTVSVTKTESVLYEKMTEYPMGNGSHGDIFETFSMSVFFDKTESNTSEAEKPEMSSTGIARDDKNEIAIMQYEVDDEKGTHMIELKNPIQQGNYSLEINYEAFIDDNAFFMTNFNDSGEEKWLIGTKLKPFGARHIFPIFDDMRLKSVFSVSIARPKEMRVLSNMPLRTSRDTWDNSLVIDIFDDTPLILPHNLAFLMGQIDLMNETLLKSIDSEIKATFWGYPERHTQGIYLLDKLEQAVINLIDVFSMPYPLSKLDLVGLPPRIDENTASLGLISMKQSLFFTTNQSPVLTKTNALMAIINLLGQQWLGGLVTMNWIDDWIIEGSLIHLQHMLVEKIDSSLNSSESFVNDVQFEAMLIDGYSVSTPLQGDTGHLHVDPFDQRYLKGACLIRMLHGAINDTAFRNGYEKFIARWRYETPDIAEFFSAMNEEAHGLPPEIFLGDLMYSWISQSGYPLVTVTRDYEKNLAIIRQEQFTYDETFEKSAKLWHIPLNYVSENDSWSFPTTIWFQSDTEMTLNDFNSNGSWILFNVNKTGYYRVHYDEQNWMLLKMALEENHELFPPETRASLIDDIFSLAAVGLRKYETAFDFIKYMQMRERHYAPWGVLMRHMFELNRLLYETVVFTEFQEFMLQFISPLYEEMGSKIEEGSPLTLVAVKMACVFEHVECLNWSKSTFENVKTDIELREAVPSYIRETFYCTIAKYGTRMEWNYFMEKAISVEDEEERKRILSAFACFQAPWILQTILNEVLHEDTFREEDILVILRTFPRNLAAAQAVSRFIRANWPDVEHRFSGSYSILTSFVLSMVNGLTTEQDLEDLEAFREHNYESMKGARHAAGIVQANGNFVTSWLKNSLPEIENFLKNNTVSKGSM